jgi:sulfur-carrier protein adenylyltransferase/sulfurtransferase
MVAMKLVWITLAIAGLALAADAPPKLSADELKDALAKTKNVLLLDVREPNELAELGTVKGSQNIPLAQVSERLAEVPKDRKIIVACNRGGRAAKAAAILQKNGYTVVGVTGLLDWKEKNYALVYPKAVK